MVFAWDSDFACTPEHQDNNRSLSNIILDTAEQTSIIANCSFHSKANMSIVLIGFNMAGGYNVSEERRMFLLNFLNVVIDFKGL